LIVHASTVNDAISVAAAVNGIDADVTINGSLVTFVVDPDETDRLTIHADHGTDTVTVSPWAEMNIDVNGGDPTAGDRVVVNATSLADAVAIQASGVTVNALPTVSLLGIERIDVNTLDDSDAVTVADMTGTNVSQVNVSVGVGMDSVEVQGTANNDLVSVEESAGVVTVNGLSALVTIAGADVGEIVRFAGGAGEDQVTTGGVAPNVDVGIGRISGALTANLDFAATESLLLHAATGLSVVNAAAFVHTPGTATDEGLLEADSLEIRYTGLGAGDTLNLSGNSLADSLLLFGTSGNDSFTVSASAVALSGRATLGLASLESITVESLDGDDSMAVTPAAGVTFQIRGGDPSASDSLTVNGSAGDDTIGVDLSSQQVTVDALGPVHFSGIEHLTDRPGAGPGGGRRRLRRREPGSRDRPGHRHGPGQQLGGRNAHGDGHQ
jgi:hypothetical protein